LRVSGWRLAGHATNSAGARRRKCIRSLSNDPIVTPSNGRKRQAIHGRKHPLALEINGKNPAALVRSPGVDESYMGLRPAL
jgi:hypothetical protein